MADLPITSNDGGMPVVIIDQTTVANVAKVNASGSINNAVGRPTEKAGRTYKTFVADAITTTTTVYTVTAGKTLYIMTIAVSGFNTNTTTAAHIQIMDNATTRFPLSFPTAGVGALASFIPIAINPITFLEPLEFATSVVITMAAGTNTLSAVFVGYEE